MQQPLALGPGHTRPHHDNLTNLTGPLSSPQRQLACPLTHTRTHTFTNRTTQPGGRAPYRVGLLCARSHVALGILVSLDQQLDEAGDDRGLLQRGMVCWAQGQVPDQANGCLMRKRTMIGGRFLGI